MNASPVNSESADTASFVSFPDGRHIAYSLRQGRLPGVVFLSGFRSDMNGAKALALDAFCSETGRRFLRFDYTGHGQSSGDFLQGTIGSWKQDVLDMLDTVAPGPNLLVGSSMGGWLMVLAALERQHAVAGLVGIASAPDFTCRLIEQGLSEQQKNALAKNGVIYVPDCYGSSPFAITKFLLDEGRSHLVLDKPIALAMPVRLIHGTHDEDVPWTCSKMLMEQLSAQDATLTLIKNGGHRLSEPPQLACIIHQLAQHPALQTGNNA